MTVSRISWSQRVVEAAILGFAFFSPWSIAGAQTCLILGLAAWAVKIALSRGHGLVGTPVGWPILAFLGVELISALLSPDRLTGLRALKEEWIVLLFFLVVNNIHDHKMARRSIDVLISVTALVGLYAIWQHFAGWDVYRHRPLRPTGGVFEATGVFGHHLTFGGYVMIVLILCACVFLWDARGRRKAGYGLAGLVMSLALLFSYARSAWFGMFAGVVGIALLRGRKALLVLLAGVVFFSALVFLLQPSVRLQVQEVISLLEDPMVKSSRAQLWSTALNIIRHRPLLGVGLGQVRRSLAVYGCDLDYAHPHNDLLNVACNAGLLGLVAFLWIWLAFLRCVVRCFWTRDTEGFIKGLAAAGFGAVIAFLLAGLFQCYYTDAEDGMILWFLLGLVMVVCRRRHNLAGELGR
jgi:O-antigen ligase